MSDIDNEFFQGKRPWSKIKDKVLGGYIPAYLSKVARLGRPILLIDGYAGPGVFDDGESGSPLIMCAGAEKHARGQYSALFVNHNLAHHQKLESILARHGWKSAKAIHGNSSTFLREISGELYNQTVFLYLDPFGLKGCEFSTLEPFLTRSDLYSTEIVINISMPIVHRLAAWKATAAGRADQGKIKSYHHRLTQVFGGSYWQDILLSEMPAEEKEYSLMQEYRHLISKHLPYTGSCPVQETSTSRIKYFITFASRHIDAMLLMNDEMCKAYFGQMHEADYADTLFESTDWKKARTTKKLDSIVLESAKLNPGVTRQDLWKIIVPDHFMQFTSSEYKQSVTRLEREGKLNSPTPRPTKRLNDNQYLRQNKVRWAVVE